MKKEVQDLTNSYKSSAASQKLHQQNEELRDEYLQIDSEKDGLYYAQQNMKISQAIQDGELDPKIYRGKNGYANYHQLTEDALRKKAFSGTLKGPMKAPSFVRSTTRIDHNPERCKDYYEHGYCGFGDTCIFIHDRGDYKSGHQLDQEYEQELKKKYRRLQHRGGGNCASDSEESNYEIDSAGEKGIDPIDGLPELCQICEGEFKEPVVTKCKHYFCDGCAIANYSRDGNCFVCGESTQGIFSVAVELVKKLKKRKEKIDRQSAEGD